MRRRDQAASQTLPPSAPMPSPAGRRRPRRRRMLLIVALGGGLSRANPAAATADLEGSTIVEYIAAYHDPSLFDCDQQDIRRQVVAELKPSYQASDFSLTSHVSGNGLVSEKQTLTSNSADGELKATLHNGRQGTYVEQSQNFKDQKSLYCTGKIEDTLRRHQDIHDEKVVPGNRTRGQKTAAGYTYDAGDAKWNVEAQTRTEVGDVRADYQDLFVKLAKDYGRTTLGSYDLGIGTETKPDLDKVATGHASVGHGHYFSRLWRVDFVTEGELRGVKEEGHGASLLNTYRLSRQTGLLVEAKRMIYAHSVRSSTSSAAAKLGYIDGKRRFDIGAQRTVMDDAQHSSGNQWTCAYSESPAHQQFIDILLGYGTTYVAQAKELIHAEFGYHINIFEHKQNVPNRGNVFISYAYERVSDSSPQKFTVRTFNSGLGLAF